VVQARVDRKRMMQAHPRSAGVRSPGPEVAAPKTAAQIVQDIRRARGFPTDG
jgi:hypothetical protein